MIPVRYKGDHPLAGEVRLVDEDSADRLEDAGLAHVLDTDEVDEEQTAPEERLTETVEFTQDHGDVAKGERRVLDSTSALYLIGEGIATIVPDEVADEDPAGPVVDGKVPGAGQDPDPKDDPEF